MTTTVDEAENLARKMEQNDLILCLTQHHTGYPMITEARRMVDEGELGNIRKVVVEYPQGWLATRIEAKGHKQASWRTNPRNTGTSCCMSDVASIAYDLAATITGMPACEVCADTATFVNGRMLDDDASVLVRYPNGARGIIWATQIGIGETQALKIRVYGEKASLCWKQSSPHELTVCPLDGKPEVKSCKPLKIKEKAELIDDIPDGHPDTSTEPLVTIYRDFAQAVIKHIDGKKLKPEDLPFHGIKEGLNAAKFTEAAIASATSDEKWIAIEY